MQKLNNNLTFAVIVKDVAWRTDITMRFCEYFSKKINGDNFLERIVFPDSIDIAISTCTTDYLIIQSSGHVICDMAFFDFLDSIAENERDIFVGNICLGEDYALIQDTCIFINIPLWQAAGKPSFRSGIREGNKFVPGDFSRDNKKPFSLSKTDERIYVTNEAALSGAELIVKQLELYDVAQSFSQLIGKEWHMFDTSSPYSEVHSETVFEKSYLREDRKLIYTVDIDDLNEIEHLTASVVVAPAFGLRANILANHFKPELIIIYDINPLALELQKLIFSISVPTLLGEIIQQFQGQYPNARFADDISIDSNVVTYPIPNAKVRYEVVDAFSFEMENLISSFDHTKSAIFDIADIFTYPFNYYKRPLFQIEGLFVELFSQMKSRAGATYIIGQAPGFKSLTSIEINTSRSQYSADSSIDPYAYDEETEEPPVVEPLVYAPAITAERFTDEDLKTGWFSSLRKSFKLPAQQIVEVIREVIVERVIEKEVVRPIEVPTTVLVRTTPELQPEAIIEEEVEPISFAVKMGYEQSEIEDLVNREMHQLILLTKIFTFEEMEAVFEYSVHPETQSWSFKVGRVGNPKRIEFSNGLAYDGLVKHLRLEMKINPKTAARYFQ